MPKLHTQVSALLFEVVLILDFKHELETKLHLTNLTFYYRSERVIIR